MARREERAYREYVSDEQRSQPGCPARELCDESLIRDTEVRSRCLVTVNVLHSAAELSTTLRRYGTTPAPDGVGSFMEILNGVFGSGLASAGGQTNPLVLSLSKDEPWDARGSTGSPRAWEPISARSKLDHYGVFVRRTCDGFG